jgi:hypothetical protein
MHLSILLRANDSKSDLSDSATAYGAGGFVNAYGSSTSTSTQYSTTYIPWSEDHPYFQQTYRVSFQLFDATGKTSHQGQR